MRKLAPLFLGLSVVLALCLGEEAFAQRYNFKIIAGSPGNGGSQDGPGSEARFDAPEDICLDADGNLYVSDRFNHTIRKISPSGNVTTVAGLAQSSGSADGTGSAARFKYPEGIAVDPTGNIFVADTDNHTIRKITPEGAVTTVAGTPGASGITDGVGSAARFSNPADVAVDASGNIFVADSYGNKAIRKISPQGVVTTLTRNVGYPTDIDVDTSGNLYVADNDGSVRKVSPEGTVVTLASLPNYNRPHGIAVDGTGNVYVNKGSAPAGSDISQMYKITPAGSVVTIEFRVAGVRRIDYEGVDVSIDGGDIYLTDDYSDVILAGSLAKLTLQAVSPAIGTISGGTRVTFTGTDFQDGATVTFGGVAGSDVAIVSGTTLRATAPPHSAGSVDVVVTNTDGGSASLTRGYEYADVETLFLTLNPPTLTVETGTAGTILAKLSAPAPRDLLLALESEQPTTAATSATAAIPAGRQSAVIYVSPEAIGGPVIIRATLPNDAGAQTATASIAVSASAFTPRLLVPGQAHVAGSGGSFFKTSFWMTNPHATETEVRLRFIPMTGLERVTLQKEMTLAPGEQVAWNDVLTEAFSAPSDTSGAIVVDVANGMKTPIVSSRTFNDSAFGTFGQYIPAVPIRAQGSQAQIDGLRGDSRFRSNLGVLNLSTSESTAIVSVFDATGVKRGHDVSVAIAPQSVVQLNGVNRAADAGEMEVFTAKVSSSGPFFAYASKLDNKTSDPVFIPGTLAPRATQWLDGVGDVQGSGAYFRSDLSLSNHGAAQATVEIAFTKWGDSVPSANASVTLVAGETKFYQSALKDIFGLAGAAGSLALTTSSSTPIVAWARTYSDGGEAGTFGQFIPGFSREDLMPTLGAMFLGISENAAFRTNMGLVNRGSATISARVSAWRMDGAKVGEQVFEIAPGQTLVKLRVMNELGAAGISDGYIKVVPSAAQSLYAWASSVDSLSTDQTFVRPLSLGTSYAGTWTGTTDEDRTVGMVIDDDGLITLIIALRVNGGLFSCTGPFTNASPGILDGDSFETTVTSSVMAAGVSSIVRGRFTSDSVVEGTYTGYRGSYVVFCGGQLSIVIDGTAFSDGTFKATRQ